jgi:rRNA-processing protein FCF1
VEQYVSELVSRHRGGGVLVDTNLLLLFFIGGYDRDLVERFPRTADRFISADYDTLAALLGSFQQIVTTPHILTETSNFMGRLTGHVRDECFTYLARSIPALREMHVAGTELVRRAPFVPLGITDTSIIEVAAEPYLVLTDDAVLYNFLATRGVDVLNFNNIRTLDY